MKKNIGGAGSGIYKDEKSGTWAFRVVRDKNYRRIGFRTRAQATAARLEFIKNLDTPAKNRSHASLDSIFELYQKEGMLSNAAGTIRKKKSIYLHHIGPAFGRRKIAELSPGEISMFLESCYHRGDVCNQFQEGYSFGYVEGFLKCFYAIIAFAYKKGFITRDQYQESLVDEASRIHMPVMKDEDVLKKRSGAKIYNRKEIEAMRNRLGEGPSRIAFEIALNCGLRVSEVFALTWSDIDLNKAALSVNKQLLKIGGNWCLCQPKYIASYRDVYINDYLLQLLTAEYDRQQKFGIANSPNHLQDLRISGKTSTCCIEDFLFVKNDGTMYSSNAFKYWSRVFKKEVGITDFNFHSLRHTFCSELAALGCPVSELCRMAGHSSINTTMNYYISSTETAQEAARKVLNQMGNRNNCPF